VLTCYVKREVERRKPDRFRDVAGEPRCSLAVLLSEERTRERERRGGEGREENRSGGGLGEVKEFVEVRGN
jgi:hypothetical protein